MSTSQKREVKKDICSEMSGNEIFETIRVLNRAGLSAEKFKLLRSNDALAREVADFIAEKITHPSIALGVFLEGKVQYRITIGGKTTKQLVAELKVKKVYISDYARDMLKNEDFTTQHKPEQIDLVILTVKELGFLNGATIDEIYQKAQELGLELCPAEVGPQLQLQHPISERTLIAMKQIAVRNGDPNVFSLLRNAYGLWLSDNNARPSSGWYDNGQFVFRFRKLDSVKS